jgi:thiol-disulfide isomerase/thioredoxin
MYEEKYLKYKAKYLALKSELENNNMTGGGNETKVDVILFKADWCGHCKKFKPVWEQLSKQFESKFNFITYDADKDIDMLEKYKVDGFPTILFKDGKHIKPYEGSREYEELENLLTNLVPV